ncbi:MAG: 60S ribosomal export protein NMD3 [Halobacteria archaeon]
MGFCPGCGEEIPEPRPEDSKNISNGPDLCNECFAEEVDPVEYPEEIELQVCGGCGSYLFEEEWRSDEEHTPLEEIVLESVKRNVFAHVEAGRVNVEITVDQRDRDFYKVECEFTALLRGVPVREQFEVEVEIKRTTCPTCSKLSGGYYESIVQVRAEGREPSENEIETSKEVAYGVASKDYSDRDTFVSKVTDAEGGIDIYMSTNKAGMEVARRVTGEFGGGYSDSPTLVGEKNGEELYRVTYAVRLPEYREGDVVLSGGSVYLITLSDEISKGVDLKTGEESRIDTDEAEKIGELEEERATVVSVSEEEIQVLDPDTYETLTLKKPDFFGTPQGEETPVVRTEEGLHLVPEGEDEKLTSQE